MRKSTYFATILVHTFTHLFFAFILASLPLICEASPPFVLPADAPTITSGKFTSSTKEDAAANISKRKRANTSTTMDIVPSTTSSLSSAQPTTKRPIKVCYQGEPGAYSEKSLRELLGPNVIAVARPNFEACYQAVASRECDYACLPFENSLGGSIHDNYDLMLRYDLTIVAEHDFRVNHCLLAIDGVKKDEIKYCMSHPQALAQCDNYLRGLGITPIPMYDTAGSAKLLNDNYSNGKDGASPKRALPDKCTPKNTAAIASDLAGEAYTLNCLDKGIEDDDTNFTRFLLLGRSSVSHHLNKQIPSKTSIVFTLPNTPGALYKALACFSLREIDFSKIESRPTSASLLNFLRFKNRALGKKSRNQADLPRFRYCFYLDFLANELDESAQNALHHLKEQAEFCRILGSYPQKSKLVGPIRNEVEESKLFKVESRDDVTLLNLPSDDGGLVLNIGIVGYGAFGQCLGQQFAEKHKVRCIDPLDKSDEAGKTGAEYYPMFELDSFLSECDVIVLAVPLIDFEAVVTSLPPSLLHKKLIAEVCPLSTYPKSILLQHLPQDADIISSNPMFGPNGASTDCKLWDGQPYVFDKVRIEDDLRANAFLRVFERARCQMVQMSSEQQDAHTADAEFVTHLAGRLLGDGKVLPPTPISSKEYAALCDVTDMTRGESFEKFYGMYKFNPRAQGHIAKLRENLAKVERQLAGKEAYLAAREELRTSDRQRLISECKQLLKEVALDNQLEVGPTKVKENNSTSTSTS